MNSDDLTFPTLRFSASKVEYSRNNECPAAATAIENTWETIAETTDFAPPLSWAAFFRRLLPVRGLTLGKLSVIILLVASMTSSKLQSPIANSSSSASISLGSAAISSVTETLSPILPFAGGLDLRREDYWTSRGNWWERVQRVALQVQDAFAASSADDVADAILVSPSEAAKARLHSKQKSKARKASNRKYVSAISAQTPFVGLDVIAGLTLAEVSETFRYAVESSRKGFHMNRFLNNVPPRVRPVIQAMGSAIERSRGKDFKDAVVVANDESCGQVDALKFAAAMRIFAEWRILRQVPEGYKGYAVGMNLGHKDVVQNVAKIEHAVHRWLEYQEDLRALTDQFELNEAGAACSVDGADKDELRSPTIYELMLHEIELDVHPTARLPRLKEKSAAMGLLWVRRQLHYQTSLFSNALKTPSHFASTQDAVNSAYREVYDRYHGWAVQKIFTYSFQAAPDVERIYRHMNPHLLAEAKTRASQVVRNNSNTYSDETSNDDGQPEHPWDQFAQFVGNLLNPDRPKDAPQAQTSGCTNDDEIVEAYVTEELTRDAHAQIHEYLEVVNPLLKDLEVLFDKLNMDDPTKV